MGMASALLQKYDGPFEVIEKIGKVAYKLKLLEHMSLFHLVFQFSQLKACEFDKGEPGRKLTSQYSIMIVGHPRRKDEKVLAHRHVRYRPIVWLEYFIKWKGLPEEENCWEWKEMLWKVEELI